MVRKREGGEIKRYISWVMGVDSRMPRYIIRKKLQRRKLKGRAGRRAWRFERRLGEGRGGAGEDMFRRDEGESGKGERAAGKRREERFLKAGGVRLKEVLEEGDEIGEWFAGLEWKV